MIITLRTVIPTIEAAGMNTSMMTQIALNNTEVFNLCIVIRRRSPEEMFDREIHYFPL